MKIPLQKVEEEAQSPLTLQLGTFAWVLLGRLRAGIVIATPFAKQCVHRVVHLNDFNDGSWSHPTRFCAQCQEGHFLLLITRHECVCMCMCLHLSEHWKHQKG